MAGNCFAFLQVGLSETARAKHLRLQSYSSARKKSMVTDDTCAICQHCFADDEKVYVLPCKHCFHDKCVAPWFKGSKVSEDLAVGNQKAVVV